MSDPAQPTPLTAPASQASSTSSKEGKNRPEKLKIANIDTPSLPHMPTPFLQNLLSKDKTPMSCILNQILIPSPGPKRQASGAGTGLGAGLAALRSGNSALSSGNIERNTSTDDIMSASLMKDLISNSDNFAMAGSITKYAGLDTPTLTNNKGKRYSKDDTNALFNYFDQNPLNQTEILASMGSAQHKFLFPSTSASEVSARRESDSQNLNSSSNNNDNNNDNNNNSTNSTTNHNNSNNTDNSSSSNLNSNQDQSLNQNQNDNNNGSTSTNATANDGLTGNQHAMSSLDLNPATTTPFNFYDPKLERSTSRDLANYGLSINGLRKVGKSAESPHFKNKLMNLMCDNTPNYQTYKRDFQGISIPDRGVDGQGNRVREWGCVEDNLSKTSTR